MISKTEYYQSVAYSYLIKETDWFDTTNPKMVENLNNLVSELVFDSEPIYDENGRNEHIYPLDMDEEINNLIKYKEAILK